MKTAIFVAALMAAAPAFAQGTTAPAPAPAAPAPAAAAPASDAKFNLDTPLQDIVADEKGKAVIEKHFPGMIALPEYEMFKAISLTQLQPYSNGKITDEMLAATAKDLAEIK
ncbi:MULTISPECIES: hypothetical protein [unclassified Sphingopyxis]|jgi:hypothetical protein|uniref:hypothetical protein n=1 Tax=unclassified Sphingopyxis TaxID=2614943 RepID=UPI0006C5D679|nr:MULTISPECIES: hypothetical protein [unclassified Sphingopyxis]USI75825.1 hypothetical protein KEC45_13725 [Sphingopyxis sp. USTB-05]GAO77637.1 hypothetical protein SC1_00928 [Sphingopyxis sp. C-1]